MGSHRNEFGSFELDPAGRILLRDGAPVMLGRRGIALLEALLDADGRPVSKQELLAHAWPGVLVEEANLSVQIAALRKTLGNAPNGDEWIATVPRVGYRFVRHDIPRSEPDRLLLPSIVVLPFENLSGDVEHKYFADGIVEDIITGLSRFKTFAVIARSSSFAYTGRSRTIEAIRRALGVRYVLDGSVRRRGNRIRVTVQLVEADHATQLWAERFEGELAGLFDFQDRITEAVIGLVEPEVRKAEIERARRKHPDNFDAYDFYLQALPYFRGTTLAARAEAIRLLEEAVRLDPGFAIALAHAAWAYERQDTFGSGMTEQERARSLELAELACARGHEDPLVVAICALVFLNVGGQCERSLAMSNQARDANPHNSTVLSLCAFCNVMAGNIEFGRQCYLRALQVAPGALDGYEILVGIGIAHLLKGEFEESVGWCLRSLALNGDWLGAHWMLAAAYAHLGRISEARATIELLRAKAPHLRVADLERLGRRYADRFQLVVGGVRKAGLPD
jgi:TolB-like protein/DNA-binding winged helix-turn-helix (wHTH) protein